MARVGTDRDGKQPFLRVGRGGVAEPELPGLLRLRAGARPEDHLPAPEGHSALRSRLAGTQTSARDERRRGRPAFVLFYAHRQAAHCVVVACGARSRTLRCARSAPLLRLALRSPAGGLRLSGGSAAFRPSAPPRPWGSHCVVVASAPRRHTFWCARSAPLLRLALRSPAGGLRLRGGSGGALRGPAQLARCRYRSSLTHAHVRSLAVLRLRLGLGRRAEALEPTARGTASRGS